MADKGATGRVGITFHVTPAQADMLDARALTLGVTRAELARSRVLGEPDNDDAQPLLAALACAVRLLHHLDGQSLNGVDAQHVLRCISDMRKAVLDNLET